MRFEDLAIIEPIMRALTKKGYTEPTPIQEQAIPHVLKRHDVLGVAQTGTGKTAAFAIPIIQLIHQIDGNSSDKPVLRSLIITPTRELAIQIDENIKEYSKFTKIKHAVVFGGVKQGSQTSQLKKGVHILVATPGRLLDLISQNFISLDDIRLFVLDEADRMLDMGFINDIEKILKLLPAKKQTLFFSATMPENIVELSKSILRNPKRVEISPESTTAETISQSLYYTNRTSKNDLLIHILKDPKIEQVLIFARTKHGADRVYRNLKKNNISSASIHGDKAQNMRQKVLQQFKDGEIQALVATDIAARGIDIDKLKYIINYEIPNIAETYVHRIGRSGRAGEEGNAISICEPEENKHIKDIEKLIGQKIPVVKDNPFPQTDKPMTDAEKKEWQKEKNRRKQEFFANRKAGDSRGSKNENKSKSSNGSSSKPEKVKQTSQNSKAEQSHKPRAQKGADAKDQGRPQEGGESNSKESPKRRSNKTAKSEEFKAKKEARPYKKKEATKDGKKRRSNASMQTKLPPKLGNKYMWPLE